MAGKRRIHVTSHHLRNITRHRLSSWGPEVPSSNLDARSGESPNFMGLSAFDRSLSRRQSGAIVSAVSADLSLYESISGIARSAAATQLHVTRSACSIRAM